MSRLRRMLLTLSLLLASCSILPQKVSRPYSANEIADNPAILYDHSIPREQMTLQGVHLGDPAGVIVERRIRDRGTGGWIMCKDGNRYRTDNGIIVTLGVWEVEVVEKLHIDKQADIEAKFGKPDSVDDIDPVVIYHYEKGKVSVLWNKRELQVNAINVSQ